jgi:hypothetical protein
MNYACGALGPLIRSVLELVPRLIAFGPPPWRDPKEMGERDLGVIEDALSSTGNDPAVYVAERSGAVVGFIHLHSVEDYYRRRQHAHVADIRGAFSRRAGYRKAVSSRS